MMELFNAVPRAIIDAIGVAGFMLYVLNYLLLTFKKISTACVAYFALNWMAASMVLIGLAASFNLAAALIQMFWIGISTVAIAIRMRDRHTRLVAT